MFSFLKYLPLGLSNLSYRSANPKSNRSSPNKPELFKGRSLRIVQGRAVSLPILELLKTIYV